MDYASRNAIEMRLREISSYFQWTRQNAEAWIELNMSILDGVTQGRAVISRFGWAPDAVISPSRVHKTQRLALPRAKPKAKRPTRRERMHVAAMLRKGEAG